MLALVAHHPDMSLDARDLQLCSGYLDFYVDEVANAANLDFLYHMSVTVKGHTVTTTSVEPEVGRGAHVGPGRGGGARR